MRRCVRIGARARSAWGAVRGFITRHRVLSGIVGAVFLGVFGGIGKAFGQYFAEEMLAWITMRL
ncbi:hypothetical protein [Streptomyces parvus]|uniref:hypothetical protein n=1 Tax=Streptomyces parvus TaxID=66428 RepID=UPI00371F8392